MKLTIFIPIILLGALSACMTSPKHVVVSPELFGYTKNVYLDKSTQLSIVDQRPGNQVVQIIKDGKPASFYSSQDTLTNIIQKALNPAFGKQGLTVNSSSNVKIDVFINTALINVTQNFMDYHVNNSITLTVNVNNGTKSISKTFSSRGKSHGPLVADMAVLERDFNHQLAALLIKITNSTEIHQTINYDNAQ